MVTGKVLSRFLKTGEKVCQKAVRGLILMVSRPFVTGNCAVFITAVDLE